MEDADVKVIANEEEFSDLASANSKGEKYYNMMLTYLNGIDTRKAKIKIVDTDIKREIVVYDHYFDVDGEKRTYGQKHLNYHVIQWVDYAFFDDEKEEPVMIKFEKHVKYKGTGRGVNEGTYKMPSWYAKELFFHAHQIAQLKSFTK